MSRRERGSRREIPDTTNGAFVASGAGLVAAAGVSAWGSIGAMSAIGAAGGVGSNTIEQVSGRMFNGEPLVGAVTNVDMSEQLLSGAIGMATGALGGAVTATQNVANARTAVVNGVPKNNIATYSDELASQGRDVGSALVHGVQNKIGSGMATQGRNMATWERQSAEALSR